MSWIPGNRASLRTFRAPLLICVLASPLVLAAPGALAQSQTRSGDAAMAETLFNEAKARMAAGDFATACPKLAESNRLDPGSGTLTALAVCHEGLGKTASAWTEFIQVVSDARQAGRADRETFAQQHVDALAPKLSKLSIVVDPAMASLPGLEVRRDGTVIGQAGWGTEAPVDPGSHTIDVTATGKKPWTTMVEVGAEADVQTVTIPALEDGPGNASGGDTGAAGASGAGSGDEQEGSQSATAEHPASSVGSTQRTAGIVVGVAGLVSAAAGTYFGVTAISKRHQASSVCPPPSTTCTDMGAVSDNDDAKSAAVVADVAFGGALVAVGVGALLYFTAPAGPAAPAPNASTARLRFLPVASTTGVSLLFDGRW